ncbi:hypothetical protein [Actinomyces lilanjuaniae]|uniref:hypothetical protein n=1 Tax=Actinomyces lilanjuaniae TaxID=2321394 RepID=UPI0013C42B87|nr:hypothetical protein [Actinomyces lilanjuaniae]
MTVVVGTTAHVFHDVDLSPLNREQTLLHEYAHILHDDVRTDTSGTHLRSMFDDLAERRAETTEMLLLRELHRRQETRGRPRPCEVITFLSASDALGSILFICSSIADVLARPVLGGSEARSYLLVAVVVLFLVGLTSGVVHRLVSRARKNLSLRLTSAVVRPLWTTTTTLHPGVRLPGQPLRDTYRRRCHQAPRSRPVVTAAAGAPAGRPEPGRGREAGGSP